MIKRIAVIGAGRYGETLIKELACAEERELGVEVIATHRQAERREELRDRYRITVLADNREG